MTSNHPIINEAKNRWWATYGDMRGWREPNWAIDSVVDEWDDDLYVDRLRHYNQPVGVAGRDIKAGELITIDLGSGLIVPAQPADIITHGLFGTPAPRPAPQPERKPSVFLTYRQAVAVKLVLFAWLVIIAVLLVVAHS